MNLRFLTGATVVALAALALLAGCVANPSAPDDDLATLDVDDSLPTASGDALDFQDAYMKTFVIEHSDGMADRGVRTLLPAPVSGSARATWPSDTAQRPFGQATGSLSDYPEPGVTTSYALAAAPAVAANAYLVTVTASFPAASIMNTYIESYYVLDRSPGSSTADGWWSSDDPIADASGAVDPSARVKMEIHFRDGSIRYETIVQFILPEVSGTGFAAFDINGPLTFPEFAYPAEDADAVFSSIIVYQQTRPTTHSFTFWQGVEDQALVGVRYYTEHFVDGDTQYKGTTVAYEKAISTLVTGGGTFIGVLPTVFLGSEHAILAENVFRKEVLFNVVGGAVSPVAVGQNSIMRSHVVDVTSQADFQLQVLNDDVTRLLAWDSESYSIPGDAAAEILENDPEAEVLHTTEISNPDGSTIVTLEPGTTPLAQLYTSIEEGTAVDPIGPDISGTLDEDGEALVYSGTIGTSFADGAPLTNTGTVEAWVYINAHTNWGGIVHKGALLDWSDEGWSLQFVSNVGDVAFAVVSQAPPSYGYEMAQSSLRLATGRWYYLVGTWDGATIRIYVDGQPRGTRASTRDAANVPGAPIVVGSQLLNGSSIADWYGFNGRINGVKVSSTVKDAATILAFYNANSSLTASW